MTKIALLNLLALGLVAARPTLAQQPKFELADVHASPTAFWFAQNTGGSLREGLYINRDATMMQLIQAAYGVTEDGIGGGPSWLKSDLFDVIAKVPEGTTPATANLMLQSLLAERFGLAIKNELYPAPRHVLSVAKTGSKLKKAVASTDSGCRPIQQTGVAISPASPPNLKATCHNMTSQQIVTTLRQLAGSYYNTYLNYEVVDSTNLAGAWDFDIEFTPIMSLGDKGRDGITIFDAVNKQLGLNLELKNVPVPLMVVSGINRKPTPNLPAVTTALAMAAPRFEVATIKPPDPAQPQFNGVRYTGGSQLRVAGKLRTLIALAFQVQPNAANDMIVGLPKSADTDVWDITAKLPSTGEGAPNQIGGRTQPPPVTVAYEMLRGLLVDQFGLKTHTENRDVTVYALTVGKAKPKLVKADPNERSDCRPDANAVKPFPSLGTMVNCKNITMAEFARNLEQATGFFDHPIVDGTGLKGGWNFMIGWSRPRGPQEAADPGYFTAYDAVEKVVGLKLVKQQRSVPVIVVDHVEDKPME